MSVFVLHRVGKSIVAEEVYSVTIEQGEGGRTDFRVETEGIDPVGRDTVITFATEEELVEQLKDAVDPNVVLDMVSDVLSDGNPNEADLKKGAAELERHLDEVLEKIRKYFSGPVVL